MDWIILFVFLWVSWRLFVWYRRKKRLVERRAALLRKYGDAEIVDKIMRMSIWQGQTEEQLLDSLGPPLDCDEKVMKNKKRETWKYRHQGGNRYGLRVTLEKGLVVGWDIKG